MIRPRRTFGLSAVVLVLASGTGPALADEPAEGCAEPVMVMRAHSDERALLRLVDCDGAPVAASLDALSVLARPKGAERPALDADEGDPLTAAGIRQLHPGLLVRLQALATRFAGHALSIVSGHRPHARQGSRHRVGRALDVAVVGVHRRVVAEFARTLPETGVGYYPNSTFTHVDVRDESYHWVDLSAPGERPRYVAWDAHVAPGSELPVAAAPADDAARHRSEETREPVLAAVEPERAAAPEPVASAVVRRERIRPQVSGPARDADVDWSLPYW